MWRKIAFLIILFVGIISIVSGQSNINITEPKDGDSVPWRPYVKGTVSDPDSEMWVIVHPMDVSDYWVQPRLSVKREGSWKVKIYIGQPGYSDVGKQFEIRAVANPTRKLNEGDVLKYWPEANWKSQIIEVIRK